MTRRFALRRLGLLAASLALTGCPAAPTTGRNGTQVSTSTGGSTSNGDKPKDADSPVKPPKHDPPSR